MAFNQSDYVKIKKLYEEKRNAAIKTVQERKNEICAISPEMTYVLRQLAATGPRIFAAVSEGGDTDAKLAVIRSENETLLQLQRNILKEHGYPEDYLDIKYDCPLCKDEGNINGRMCECMRARLVTAGYESAGIAALADTHNFESFDLSYYDGDGRSRANMNYVFERAKEYADGFSDKGRESLLFFGGTGLGKTHLSVAVAKRVIERGYYVIYDTAQNIFAGFEYERFLRSYSDTSENKTDRFFKCDLLVIDDLGTEIKSQPVTAFLYNLINTRLNSDKATVINTNLSSPDMIVERYDNRVASRLFGEFKPYKFTGKDVRMLKLKK